MYLQKISLPLVAAIVLTACSDSSDRYEAETPEPEVPPSSLTIIPMGTPEGAPGEMLPLVFRVALIEPQADPVYIQYETSGITATGDDDYLDTMGEATIAPGELETTISVDLIGDAEEEPAETFRLGFTTSGNAVATTAEVLGTLSNDDTACDAPFSKDPNPWIVGDADPLNYAHRGGVTDYPENTIYAYAEVAVAGADVLEMDVYQTADNELVVLHDLDVDRTTNGSGNVVDLTLAELRELDAAYWFVQDAGTPHDRPDQDYLFRGIATGDVLPPPGYTPEDFRIPTLEEILQRFPHELINLELKPDLDGEGNYEQQIAELLQRYGRSTDIIVASFVDEAASNFKAAAPCVHTSPAISEAFGLILRPGPMPPVPEHVSFQVPPDTDEIGGGQIPDGFFYEVVTPEFVARSHAADMAVQVWTINTCEDMLRMIALGVDAIMTDRPLLLEELLDMPPEGRSCN